MLYLNFFQRSLQKFKKNVMPIIILIVGKLDIFLGVKAWCMIFASSVLGKGAKNMTLNIHKFLVLSQALKDYGMNKQLHIRIMFSL